MFAGDVWLLIFILYIDVVMHLLNTRLWIVRIFKGYFVSQQNPPDQEFRRLPIMALGNITN